MARMRRPRWTVLLFLLAAVSAAAAGPGAPWGYHGAIGPEHWAELDPNYAVCGAGEAQSPIDVRVSEPGAIELAFAYGRSDLWLKNNGHTIEADLESEESSIRLDGESYRLLQFHWHAPSEHTLAGVSFPLEMHLVHRRADGALAVVGVFLRPGPGPANPALDELFAELPPHAGEARRVADFDVAGVLPAGAPGEFFGYPGSLTTPACGEGVRWLVLAAPEAMSAAGIRSFVEIFSGPDFPRGNRRPVEPLHGRAVVRVDG